MSQKQSNNSKCKYLLTTAKSEFSSRMYLFYDASLRSQITQNLKTFH